MLDDLCIHQKLIAILLLPVVLAAGRIRSTSRRACGQGGLPPLAIWRR
jgi:hypothetical protein